MIVQTVVLGLGALAALIALAALTRSSERGAVRAAAWLALAAVWLAAVDWPVPSRDELPPELHVAATGAGDGAWLDRLRASGAATPGAVVTVDAAAGGDPRAALVAAALRARDPRDVALVWDGTFEPGESAPFPGVRAFTLVPAPAVEPRDLSLRVVGGVEVQRPAALELEVARAVRAGLPAGASARVEVQRPDGASAVARDVASAELAEGPVRLPWTPQDAGPHAVHVTLTVDGSTIDARGALEVAVASAPVVVVGAGGAVVVGALRAQGIAARAVEALPEELPERGVVVALAPLDADAQRRLDGFCDAGGGLVLVGGVGGGALPAPDAPLAGACPLVRQPELPDDAPGTGAGDHPVAGESTGEPTPADRPDATPPRVEPPPAEPGRESKPPDGGVQGDTSAARDAPIQPVEVERRRIAMVLVVDRSGSMDEAVRGATTKMDFLKRSAFETARQLEAGDALGIVAFGSRAYEVLPLGPVPGEQALRAAVERLRAQDPATLVADAVERAGQWLSRSDAPVRHAVVITDGDSLDLGDVTRAQAAARRMAAAGVTVSLIQIASSRYGLSSDVARIASLGGGQFVRETDGGAIPRLVFAEVSRALGAAGRRPSEQTGADAPGAGEPAGAQPGDQPADRVAAAPPAKPPEPPPPERPPVDPRPAEPEPPPAEPPALRVVALEESPLLEPAPAGEFPPLRRVNPVVATRRAHVLLATVDGTPLLAFAHRGLGRVAAWSADWTGPWSEAWRADPEFPARVATWVEAVRPPASDATARDRLDGARTRSPAAPTRAELEVLAGFAGGVAPRPAAELALPPPRVVERVRGRAADFALLALPTLLLLALVEWWERRR